MPPRYKSMQHRLLANIEIVDECWVWTAKIHKKGYGQLTVYSKEKGYPINKYAHRVSHETFNGPIPEGFEVDHRCRNRTCINPAHLQAVTKAANLKRRVWRKREGNSELVIPLPLETEG